MKTLGKILLGIVGIIVVGVVAVFYFTSDMVKAADGFFDSVKQQDMTRAASFLSEDFRRSTPEGKLSAFLVRSGLTGVQETSWSGRSVEAGKGSLIGSVTTSSGGAIPLKIDFVKENGEWKIYALNKPPAGIQEGGGKVVAPSENEAVALVAESMQQFALAVNAKSMAGFLEHVSNLWRRQTTAEKLDESYGAFYKTGMDLTVLQRYSPSFDSKPVVDDDNVIVISGFYPTRPSRVTFTQKYMYEGLSWKLVGFKINVAPVDEKKKQ